LRFLWILFKLMAFLFALIVLNVGVRLSYIIQNPEKILTLSFKSNSARDSGNRDSKTRMVAIAGREFEIPIAYVGKNFRNGRIEGVASLGYSLPDFTPLEFRDYAERMKAIHAGDIGRVVLRAATEPFYLDTILAQRKEEGRQKKYEGQIYGLNKYTFPAVVPFDVRYEDLYIEYAPDGTVISYIECSLPEQFIVHVCQSTFDDKGLRYQIDFPLRELPNWKVHQQATINFMDGFKITNNTQEEEQY